MIRVNPNVKIYPVLLLLIPSMMPLNESGMGAFLDTSFLAIDAASFIIGAKSCFFAFSLEQKLLSLFGKSSFPSFVTSLFSRGAKSTRVVSPLGGFLHLWIATGADSAPVDVVSLRNGSSFRNFVPISTLISCFMNFPYSLRTATYSINPHLSRYAQHCLALRSPTPHF